MWCTYLAKHITELVLETYFACSDLRIKWAYLWALFMWIYLVDFFKLRKYPHQFFGQVKDNCIFKKRICKGGKCLKAKRKKKYLTLHKNYLSGVLRLDLGFSIFSLSFCFSFTVLSDFDTNADMG